MSRYPYTLLEGTTAKGDRIKVVRLDGGIIGTGRDEPFVVTLNGKSVKVTGRCALYRDGGTISITSEIGRIVKRNRLGPSIVDKDTRAFLDGELIKENG